MRKQLIKFNLWIIDKRLKFYKKRIQKLRVHADRAQEVTNQIHAAIYLEPANKKLRKYRKDIIKALDYFEIQLIKAQEVQEKLMEKRYNLTPPRA